MGKGLSPRTVISAALVLVDREGLGALSMRRLAAELGVDPMAAYRHVPNKEALLDGVVDAVLAEVDFTGLHGPWESQFHDGVVALVHGLLRHPNAMPLLSQRTWTTPHGLAIIEWGMRILVDNGVPPHRAVLAMNTTGLFVVSLVQAMHSAEATDPASRLAALSPVDYPVTVAAVSSGQGATYPQMLEFWLNQVIAALRDQPARPSGPVVASRRADTPDAAGAESDESGLPGGK